MSSTTNKQTVEAYFGHFEHSRIREVLGMMTDDSTWEIVGKPHLFPGAGVKSKLEMARIWERLYGVLDGGLRMHVQGLISDGDLVAAEVRSHAMTTSGKLYENDYHFLVTLRDGKIFRVKEYTDLMHAAEVFG